MTDLLREFEANQLGAVLCVNKEESFRQAEEAQKKLTPVFQRLIWYSLLTKMFLLREMADNSWIKDVSGLLSPFDATVVKRIAESGAVCSANLVATSLQWVLQTKTVPLVHV